MEYDNRLRFYCERRLYAGDFALHIATGSPVSAKAKPIEFEAVGDGVCITHDPALTLSETAAQELIDELWNAGLRPTRGRQSEGVTAAQARHLEDMRALVFAKLKITQPERT